MSKIGLTIDGKEVQADSKWSILEAALENGIYIPHLCYQPELKPEGVCRLCMVEMADGELMTACRVEVVPGMVIRTKSEKIDRAIRPVVEMMIAYHHDTCRGCPALGHCELQKVMSHLKIDRRRVRRLRPPASQRVIDTSNPCFDYDPNRCVLCGICVRTCADIQGSSRLYYLARGQDTAVSFQGDAGQCLDCLKCVARCPVSALILKVPQ